ncbi:cell wall protein DAN4 [Salmo salar]|uniref:Cell wall protein DAN4 n=1 Tax=Salmo salar TaxID=8030 RepID=A0A1S3NLB0_SALSA|nr:cell wall protein DAN4 [Salmo salar]XP_045558351.1 cell wall protein DAN4 [Salmo salar]
MEKKPIIFGIILTLAVSALLFFDDVVPVSHLRRATPSSNVKTTPATLSTYYICVRITNRIYTESLNNQNSKEYKQLRKQVEQMMDDVHSPLSESAKYMGVFDIIFSNGSVIANSTVRFGTTLMITPTLVKGLFSTHIQSNKSKTLDLDLAYTEGQLPIKATLPLVARTTATVAALDSTASRSGWAGDATTSTAITSSGNITSSHTLTTTTTSPDKNTTTSNTTTPSPGEHNTTTSNTTTPSPGEHNTTTSNTTTPSPGDHNTTTSNTTNPSPGEHNTTTSNTTNPSPGEHNTTTSNTTTPSPGEHNTTTSNTTTPSPGDHNTTTSKITPPSPGEHNTTTSKITPPSPGEHNTTTSKITPPSPGDHNTTTSKITPLVLESITLHLAK